MSLFTRLNALRIAIKKNESSVGVILLISMALALVMDNTSLAPYYDALLSTLAGFRIGEFQLQKPLLLWINDGLMAIFFLLIGLEVKREIIEGHLSSLSKVILPGVAAVGGMVAPALVYFFINSGDAMALKGWAIPVATDIAFALGLLSLFGTRAPTALKVFLLSLAVIDDLGAIVIIAVFYTADLSVFSLIMAGVMMLILFVLNRSNERDIAPYALVGAVLWFCVLKSGVHATLAGVVLAFAIPLKRDEEGHSPLITLEHDLHSAVMYGIMPIFAFANSGISLKGLSFEAVTAPVPLGIALGLFIGKQLGVFGFSFAAVKMGICKLPTGVKWKHIYAISLFTGVGFTMSLFISSLAFEQGGETYQVADRLGILVGSALSAIFGFIVMHMAVKKKEAVS